ncbi:hypothetical protein AJ78_02783 [Emergomyces pasteurianus Ep9510]|uniref:Uncharacterized protein n=1 Tax=Emergomyces pasteurianus Ep9510 TaxID=1447872 RepID=A0A1J9QA14_9EURO|nr:hypothetical protein AJ78_02783 [Emergomyces pasteurianus Ep9510]
MSADTGSMLNIDFTFSVEDRLEDIMGGCCALWTFGRNASEESVCLMADFGFWHGLIQVSSLTLTAKSLKDQTARGCDSLGVERK